MSDDDWSDEETTKIGDRAVLDVIKAARKAQSQRAYIVVIAGRGAGTMFQVAPTGTIIGRGEGAGVRIFDEEISRKHCRLKVNDAGVMLEDLGSRNGTLVNGELVQGSRVLADGDKIQIGTTTILKFSYHDELEADFQKQIYESALRDPLTGAYNRKHFSESLAAEMAYSLRHRSPLSLILFDVDFFKKVNDVHGHLGGDRVLVALAKHVQAAVRREDIFSRYGGEEFAVLARGIDREHAAGFAERLRAEVEKLAITHESKVIPITISLGVASAPADDIGSGEELVSRADDALYAAKRGGRNRVVVH